ncbi:MULTISPECIES: outer membrane protein [Bradyrhizobium]|uniref:outer membrane protein n=1 Tax=Bradyrhizobium TaxID=374 RepID=UPI000942B355|nr:MULTISPECIES: outer membrane beta-barrel protein [Bradyrhizobium]
MLGAFVTVPITRLKADFTLVPGVVFNLRPQSAVIGAVRLGYAVNNFLPYVFGGVAYSKIEATSPFGPSPSNEHVGSVIGVGLEYRVAQHWSVDFRYARISLPKKTYDFGGGFEQYGEDSNNYKIAGYYRF